MKVVGVCTANILRSASFEAVMRYATNEEQKKHEISSAGLLVEEIIEEDMRRFVPYRNQLNMIRAALHYNLVRKEIESEANRFARMSEQEVRDIQLGEEQCEKDGQLKNSTVRESIQKIYGEVRPLVHGRNLTYRDIALTQAGIPNHLFPAPYTKFKLESDFDLVLPFTDEDVDEIKRRYPLEKIIQHDQPERAVPHIMTYGTLLHGHEERKKGEVKDDLQGGLVKAVEIVEFFMDTRRQAMGRFEELARK